MTPLYYFDENPLDRGSSLPPLALFLDFDGTLTPIQQNPDRTTVKGEVGALLASILGTGKSVLAILSGRPLADLETRISIPGAYYAGSHGLEIKGPGMRYIHEPALSVRPLIDRVRHNLAREIEGLPAVRIEEKPFSFALHYRGVPNHIASMAQETFYRAVETLPADAPPFTVMAGKKVLELVPCPSWNKGAAALYIMAGMGKEYLPVCVGDDVTDETLFETFRGKGVTIRVGRSRNSIATYYLKDQREVFSFLKNIKDLLSPSKGLS